MSIQCHHSESQPYIVHQLHSADKDSSAQRCLLRNFQTRNPWSNGKAKISCQDKNYAINNKYGTEDVVINKNTTITPTTAAFEYHSQENVISISSLTNVTSEQLVAIKGYLAHLSATKKIIVQGSELKKQEGNFADPSGYIKFIFWGNHTDKVQQGSTYFFNKVRVKVSQDQKYLNTPKQESECTIQSAEPFTEPLPVLDEVSTCKEMVGSIIGISNVNKYSSCCTCAKNHHQRQARFLWQM